MATSTIRNPYNVVQSKSIHSSLTNLTKETDEFRRAARSFESKFHQLSRELTQRYRPQQKQLLEQIREARVIAGRAQQQARSLATEKERLNRQLLEKSKQLKDACEEETGLVQEEADTRLKWVQEISEMNSELSSMLKSQEEERLMERLSAALAKGSDGICEILASVLPGSDGADDESAKVLESLQDAYHSYKHVLNETKAWQIKVSKMRASVLELQQQSHHDQQQRNKTDPILTESGLRELERVWAETWKEDNSVVEQNPGTGLGSPTEQSGWGNGSGNQDNDEADSPNSLVHESITTPVGDKPQDNPVHMQLFYETTGQVERSDTMMEG
ncbi:hypothetical protein ACA910_007892 [Epithemia clementina (nom. ined.)]